MRNRVMKAVSMSLVLLMSTSLLAGCGNGGDSGTSSSTTNESAGSAGENETILFWNGTTDPPDVAIYGRALDKFNSETQSGYNVEAVHIQNDIYKERLIVAMSSGETPDMYTTWSGGPMNEYIESGHATPITELFNNSELPNRLMEAAIAQATYKDDIYAVPFINVALSGFYYNTEMFEKYGLEEPTTLAELEAICETLKAEGITPFALANAPKWTGSMYFMNLAARKGGLEPFQDAVAGTGSFEEESFIYAGDKIIEWTEKGYFPEGVNSLNEDDGQSRQLIYQETAAMSLIGSWYTGILKEESEEFYEKVGWFPFPAIEDGHEDASIMIGTIGDNFISFSVTGDKLEAAFECATQFSEPEIVEYMVEMGKVPPIDGIESQITDLIPQKIVTAANNASSTQLWYDQYLPPSVAQVHLDTSQELFGLTMTSEEAARQFQEAMQKYIDDNN
jgi:ABC-type sugar transport system, periplasmic component